MRDTVLAGWWSFWIDLYQDVTNRVTVTPSGWLWTGAAVPYWPWGGVMDTGDDAFHDAMLRRAAMSGPPDSWYEEEFTR
jgi:hypothetical protein